MDDERTNSKLAWIIGHKNLILGSGLIIILLLFVRGLLVGSALAYIEISADFGVKDTTVYTSADRPLKKAGSSGLIIIPRDTKNIIVTSGDSSKTQTSIDIPWYGFVYKKVALKKSLNAEKVAYYSTKKSSCAVILAGSGTLGSYDCDRPVALTRYVTPENGAWLNKKIKDLNFSVVPIRPFMGGLLGITYRPLSDVRSEMVFITEQGMTSLNLPLELDRAEIYSTQLYSDTNDTNNNRFALVGPLGDVYVGTVTGRNVSYQHFDAPPDYNRDYNQTLCALTNASLHCYRGPSALGDPPSDFDFSKVTASEITTYALSGGPGQTNRLSGNLFTLNELYVTSGGSFFARKDYRVLYHFAKTGNTYKAHEVSQNIRAAAAGEKMYFIQESGVFAVDDSSPTDSYQVLYSANISPKSIYPVDGKVFVLGSQKSTNLTTYAYQLTDETNSLSGKRLIDLLPLESNKNPDIYSSDLVGDRIYITLRLSQRDLSSQDMNLELAQKKESVTNWLLSNGVPVSGLKITFDY